MREDAADSEQPELDLDDLVATRKRRFSGCRQKLDRVVQLMRTYPPRQVILRGIKTGKRHLGIRYRPTDQFDAVPRDADSFSRLYELKEDGHSQGVVSTGKLTLLNEQHEVGYPIDWRCDSRSRPGHLWRFQLHYHEWLLPLFETSPELVWQIVDHWIDCNRYDDAATHDDAWHPYCISRRLPVWMKLAATKDGSGDDVIQKSLLFQADFLAHNLETDLRGNHLLENYHALAMAGCFFKGEAARKWRATSHAGLQSELDYQILASGEHYERSPMYQSVVCGNLLQLAIASRAVDGRLHELVKGYAIRMLEFLNGILCPDGEIPLLSDSCFREGPSVAQLGLLANELEIDCSDLASKSRTTVVGDYWVNRSDDSMLLFDVGELAAKGLPGHAHCDLLNVVGSVNGRRLLVDSGNGSYGLDSKRAYCRSSVAHNVTTVDQIDHADVWSKFRMGFRGAPSGFRHGSENSLDWAIAEHDAYRRSGVQLARRMVISGQTSLMWVCVDYFEKTADRSRLLEGYLHFAESVSLTLSGQNGGLIATSDFARLKIGFFGCDQVQLAKSWQCSEFGRCSRNYAVVYRKSSDSGKSLFGWYLCDFDSPSHVDLIPSSSSEIAISFDDRDHHFDLMNCQG